MEILRHVDALLSIVPEESTQEHKISGARYLADIVRCAVSETLGFWRKSSSESLVGAVILAAVPLIGLGSYLYFSRGFGVFVEWITALGVGVLTLALFLLLLFALGIIKAPLTLQNEARRQLAAAHAHLAATQLELRAEREPKPEARPNLVVRDFREETRTRLVPERGNVPGSSFNGYKTFTESFLLLTVENDPDSHDQACIASNVVGTIDYEDGGGHTKRLPVRWVDEGQPSDKPPERFSPSRAFGIGAFGDIVIAVKPLGDLRCYAVTDNGIHNEGRLLHVSGEMQPGDIVARLRLRDAGVDETWRLAFANPNFARSGENWKLRAAGISR